MRRWWNRFFFEPASTLPLAMCRIVNGFIAFVCAAMLFPDRFIWFGDRGLVSPRTAIAINDVPVTSLFHWTGDVEPLVTPLLVLMMIAGLTLTAGFFTRTSAAIVFLVLMALHHRTSMILSGADMLLRINALLLAFSHAGASLSVDARRDPRPRPLQPPWAQRLMQIQLAIVYAGTMIWKLHGRPWIDGTAVYYVMTIGDFQRWQHPTIFLPLVVSKIVTWSTLVIEAAAATLIWFKPFRMPVLVAAILMHVSMEIALNVPMFQWLMVGSLLLFIEPAEVRRGWQRVRARRLRALPDTART